MSNRFLGDPTSAFSFSFGVGFFMIELFLHLEGHMTGWLLVMSAFLIGIPIGIYFKKLEVDTNGNNSKNNRLV